MDLAESVTEILDNTAADAESIATTAYLFRKQLGLTPEPGASLPAGADAPKVVPDTGPRLSPDEWDKSVRAGLDKKSAPPHVNNPPNAEAAAPSPGKAAPADVSAPKSGPSSIAGPASGVSDQKVSHAEAQEAKAATPSKSAGEAKAAQAGAPAHETKVPKTPDYLGRIEPELGPAHTSNVAAPKPSTATAPHEAHTHKAPSAVTEARAPHTAASLKAPHALPPAVSASVHRAEVVAAELLAKESASVALKGAMRVVAGPEVAVGVAIVTAIPRAYSFVDEASGHAISKSSFGQGVAYLNERSGANAAAEQVSGWVDAGLDALERAAMNVLEKTGGDKVLVKASEFVSQVSAESGLSAGLSKVGELWDSGAARLEQVIRDNVHGPDNPALKTPVAAATAAMPTPAPAPAPAEVASVAGAIPPVAASSHQEHAPVKPALAVAPQATEVSPTPSPHPQTSANKPTEASEAHASRQAGPTAPQEPPAPAEHAIRQETSALAAKPTSLEQERPVPVVVTATSHVATLEKALYGPAPESPGVALLGSAGLAQALAGHMETHGMAAEAQMLADPMSRALSQFLEKSPSSGTSLVINQQSDAVATMVGPEAQPAAGDLPQIQSETLENVAKSGICQAGVSELRECLPAEVKGKSDLDLADAVGVAALAKIGATGLDVQAVDKLQEHIVKSTQGTDFASEPDRLSMVKVLHDMGESDIKNFAVIEREATGSRVLGAMSESEFAAQPGRPGADLIALDVSDMRKELSLPESTQRAMDEARATFDSIPLLAQTLSDAPPAAGQAPQPKPEAPAPEPVMER